MPKLNIPLYKSHVCCCCYEGRGCFSSGDLPTDPLSPAPQAVGALPRFQGLGFRVWGLRFGVFGSACGEGPKVCLRRVLIGFTLGCYGFRLQVVGLT